MPASLPDYIVGNVTGGIANSLTGGAGSVLSPLTVSGTSQNYDGNSNGYKLITGATAGAHVGYVTSAQGASISILSQSVANLLAVTAGGHVTAGAGAAAASAGSATVTYQATKVGYPPITQVVTYTVRAAISLPFLTAPYVGWWGDSIFQFNGGANLAGTVVNNGLSTGDGEFVATFARFAKFNMDQWYAAANTQATSGNVPFYTWGANQGLAGDSTTTWAARTEAVIASQFDILNVAIGVNSLAAPAATNAALIFAALDTYHAACPSVPVNLFAVRPTSVALVILRDVTSLLALNALLVAGAATRSSWCTYVDVFTPAANNPVAASNGVLTFTAQPLSTSSFTLNGQVVTFGTTVVIGANLAATLNNVQTLILASPGTYASNGVNLNNTQLSFAGTSGTLMTLTTSGTINATAQVVQTAANQTAVDYNFMQPNAGVAAASTSLLGNDGLHPRYAQNGPLSAPAIQAVLATQIDSGVANPILARGTGLASMTSAVKFMSGSDGAITPSNGVSGVVPSGWSVVGFAGQNSTCVVSTEANGETGGKNIVNTITSQGAAFQERYIIRPSGISFATNGSPNLAGLWGQTMAEIEADLSSAWTEGILALLPNNNAGAIQINGSCPTTGLGGAGTQRFWLATFPAVFPTNTTSSGWSMTFSFNPSLLTPGTTLVMKMRQIDFRQIPDVIAAHRN